MSLNSSMTRDLTKGNLFSQLIMFTLPILAANLLQIVYTLVDMIIIGRFVGSAGISAVSVGGETLMLFTAFSMGLCSAGQVIISQYIGSNSFESVSKTIGTLFSFIIVLAIVLTTLSLPLISPILRLLNTPAEAWSHAVDYTTTCVAGLVFIFGYNAVSAVLRGMGNSRHPLIFIGIATVANIILDLLFVGVLHKGTFGAALATVSGQGLSFIISLCYLYRKKVQFGFDFRFKSFIPDHIIFKMLVRLGIPMALQYIAVCISGLYVTARINSYGVIVSALSGIGNKLRTVIAIISSSFGTGGSAMMAQNIGANKYDRVRKLYILIFAVLLIFCVVLGGIGVLFPKTVIALFDTNTELLPMANRFMLINLVTYIAFAIYQPFPCLINGIGHASFALILGIIDGFVARIGLVFLLEKVLHYGYWGIWWGAALAAYVGAFIGIAYFLSGRWKKRKPITRMY